MSEKQAVKEPLSQEMETKAETTKAVMPEKKVAAKRQECTYTAEEFAMNAQALFKTRPECVKAAFHLAKVTSCTKTNAERIVKEFLKKEVK